MASIDTGYQSHLVTSQTSTLNREETYDLRDAARFGDQFGDALQDLIASSRANGNATVSPEDDVAIKNHHPDDSSVLDLFNRAQSEGGPLASFLQSAGITLSTGTPLSFEEAEALLTQVRDWSSSVRDALPGTTRNSGLVWDAQARSFILDGRSLSLQEAYSEIRLKQADEIQTALAYRANSLDLRNRNIRALNDVSDQLKTFLTDGAWDRDDAIALGDKLYSGVNRPTLPIKDGSDPERHENYEEYTTRINNEFQALTGLDLLSQLQSQGITSFFGSSADETAGEIGRAHIEQLIEAIDSQRESLENDNAIAAQQDQRLEDQLRIIYTSVSSFTRSDTAVAGSVGRQI